MDVEQLLANNRFWAESLKAREPEFFARLAADKRDIMPTTERPDFTPWRVTSTRAMWGWSTPGWRNPGAPKAWAVQS